MIAALIQRYSKKPIRRTVCRECGMEISRREGDSGLCLACNIKLNNDIRILDEETNEFVLE